MIRRTHVRSFLALLIFAAAPASAQNARTALIARLDSLANAPIAEGRAVGASIAVVRGSDTLIMRGYGKASLELDVKTPPRAVYEIGSVTKQFTAAAILQLRDDGKLDLDADMTRYLPNFPTRGNKVTVRHLLNHTSGIKGITEIAGFPSLFNRGFPRDSAIAMIARAPFDFPTGEAMIYNNSAFILLGHIVEKVSGMTYEDYIEQKIFAPLGMRDSRYCNNSELIAGRARGYAFTGPAVRVTAPNDHTWPFSAGSLCSTTADLVTWLAALHGGKVLSERSYKEMTTPARLNDGTELRYGMGIAVGPDIRGAKVIGHGGAIDGFTSDTRWYPDANLSVVVLFNSGGPVSPAALSSELAGAVIPPVVVPGKIFTGDAEPLVGKYAGPSRGRVMTVEVTKGPQGLAISANGSPARPLPWDKDWSFRVGDANIIFERKGNSGPATLLRFDAGSGYYMLKRQ